MKEKAQSNSSLRVKPLAKKLKSILNQCELLYKVLQDFKNINSTNPIKIEKMQIAVEISSIIKIIGSLAEDIKNFPQLNIINPNYALERVTSADSFVTNKLLVAKTVNELIVFCAKLGLAKRESECIFYMIRGLTAKQIGKNIGISYRTVQFYLDTAKSKLKCNTKSELIAKIFDFL